MLLREAAEGRAATAQRTGAKAAMPLSTYQPERMGRAVIEPAGAFEAGAFQSFTLTYTAGYYGIDDTGSLKVVQRFASDMGKPQLDDPTAANYVTVEASNGAMLACHYHGKQNIRPWDKTLYIQVVRGFLREGDRITVRFGDPRRGSPGMRQQTFCEDTSSSRFWSTPSPPMTTSSCRTRPPFASCPACPCAGRPCCPRCAA